MIFPTILVTRPSPQGEKLCAAIDAAGGVGIFFPAMRIVPCMTKSAENYLKALQNFDVVIFISPNAVHHSAPFIRRYYPAWPNNTTIAATGAGTAAALQEYNFKATLVPDTLFTSESLIKHPDLLQVASKKILIVRGVGGKTLLADTLQARQAHIFHAIAYERQIPLNKTQELSRLLQQKIDAIVTTSEENLLNLWHIADEKDKPTLCTIPLVVISEKMVAAAKRLGFAKLLLTDNPRNETIVTTLFGKSL